MAGVPCSLSIVRLPCFEGYNQFALWPAPQLVSISLGITVLINSLLSIDIILSLPFQTSSCYGLLDTSAILSPINTGQYVDLVYYPGYCYAAYKAKDVNKVIRIHNLDSNDILTLRCQKLQFLKRGH